MIIPSEIPLHTDYSCFPISQVVVKIARVLHCPDLSTYGLLLLVFMLLGKLF